MNDKNMADKTTTVPVKGTTGSDAVDLNKMRAEFEAWAIDNEFDIAKYSDGEYCSDLNRYWLGWQAALIAQARAAAPAATDRDILAEAIAHAAEKRGIIKAGTALTGPQLVMLCADLAEPPPVLLQAATARPADDLAPHPELQLIMSQQPVQAAGDDFTAHSPDCRNYGCTGCADPAELSRLLAPVIAAPTAPIDLSKLTKWGAGMIAVGWQDDKELYVKVSDLERTLSAPTATAEPVETDLTCDKLALLLVGKHVNDYGYRMLLNGEEIGFNLQDLLDIVKLAAPVPQQAPLTDEAIERAASTQEGAKNA